MKVFFKCQPFLILLLTAGCVSNREGNTTNYPEAIRLALRRLPTIPKGMKEGDVFAFLGLSQPEDSFVNEVETTGETGTLYRIGYGDSFVLHCQSENTPPLKSNGKFSYSNGVLFRVEILRLRGSKAGKEPRYEPIPQNGYGPHVSRLLKNGVVLKDTAKTEFEAGTDSL